MGQSEGTLRNLGQHVAALVDDERTAEERAAGRQRLIEADLPVAPRRSSSPLAARRFGLLVAAVAVAAIVFLAVRRRPSIAFEVGAGEPGAVGAWIAAPTAAAMPLRFSDGSSVRLAAGGRARVSAIDADGAEISLESGTMDLAIVHRDRTRWRVQVGPFLVKVVGTRFETSWDPAAERFSVALHEGAVVVDGPVVGVGRAVRAGERITIMPRRGSLVVSRVDEPEAEARAPDETPSSAADRRDTDDAPAPAPEVVESVRPSPSSSPSAETREPSWRSLAVDAKYRLSLAAAEQQGFSSICQSAGVADLHLLADAARLGGSAARSRQAFTTLRNRFPGSIDASYAAFMLGRSAHEAHDESGAATWFERYLREQPGGAFAEEASGRLVEIADRGGDAASARRAAERYLATYPGGPHAEHARRVIARGAP